MCHKINLNCLGSHIHSLEHKKNNKKATINPINKKKKTNALNTL